MTDTAASTDATTARAERFVRRFNEGHASHDPAIFGGFFHPHCRVDYPTVDGTLNRDGVMRFWADTWRMIPDLHVASTAWAASGDLIFVEWAATGTINGTAVEWMGVDRFTLEGDVAVSEGNYWDTHVLRTAKAGAPARSNAVQLRHFGSSDGFGSARCHR